MPTYEVRLSAAQIAALDEARKVLALDRQAFAERALAALCVSAGVEFPPRQHAIQRAPQKRGDGRPRHAITWPMRNDVPADSTAIICPGCGRVFHNDNPHVRYCAQECRARVNNAKSYHRRLKS